MFGSYDGDAGALTLSYWSASHSDIGIARFASYDGLSAGTNPGATSALYREFGRARAHHGLKQMILLQGYWGLLTP
jgi:hypothetical protein